MKSRIAAPTSETRLPLRLPPRRRQLRRARTRWCHHSMEHPLITNISRCPCIPLTSRCCTRHNRAKCPMRTTSGAGSSRPPPISSLFGSRTRALVETLSRRAGSMRSSCLMTIFHQPRRSGRAPADGCNFLPHGHPSGVAHARRPYRFVDLLGRWRSMTLRSVLLLSWFACPVVCLLLCM